MHQEREIRQESYLATKYEKVRQDVGLFYVITYVFAEFIRPILFSINFPRGVINL